MLLHRRLALRCAAPLTLGLLVALSAPAQAAPRVPAAPAPAPPEVHSTPFSVDEERPVREAPPFPELTMPDTSDAPEYASDHVLVRFAKTASPSQQRSSLSALGTEAEDTVDGTGWVQVDVGDQDPAAVVAELDDDPHVADVQLDHVRHAFAVPNDPWADSDMPYFEQMRLARAWDASTGAGIVVAVLDTGIYGAHNELAGSVLPGTDLVAGDSDPEDVNGHGTLVAGVVAAHGNNAEGAAGAAYDAKILPVKVLADDGSGTDSTVAAGIAYAVSHDADVINLSLGGTDPAPVLLTAIQNAVAAGVVVVAAAGNEGTSAPMYPAAYAPQVDGLLAVGATDDYGSLTTYSSWGDWVSLAAPGDLILGPGIRWPTDYGFGSGTSLAAPFVSGTAALVLAHATSLTPSAVEQRLVSTAVDAGPRGIDPSYGHGVLDAAAAVTVADSSPAAPGVPLDRAPADASGSDDTRSTARVLPDGGVRGTIRPEGDVDWYQFTASSAGWYTVQVKVYRTYIRTVLEPVVEVRNEAGDILATGTSGSDLGTVAHVPMPVAGKFYVKVSSADGAALPDVYAISAARSDAAPEFVRMDTVQTDEDGPMAVGDVTGDGRGDAVSAPAGGSALRVYAGQTVGSVAAPTSVPLPSDTLTGVGIASADVNGDGRLDVVAGTTAGLRAFTQTAGGELTGGTAIAPVSPQQVVPADVDGDGDQDLVLTLAGGAQIAKNDGTGTFTLAGTIPSSTVIAVGDITRDGRPDIVDAVHYFAQNADGSFAAAAALPDMDGGNPSTIAVADVTGDGFADVVRPSETNDGFVQVDSVLANQTFATPRTYAADEIPAVITTGDVNSDGRTDVVVANRWWGSISMLPQQSDGTLGAPITLRTRADVYGSLPDVLKVTDVDGDGHNDVVIADRGISVFHQVVLDENALDQPPVGRGWLKAMSPAPHSAGVALRPTVTVALERALKAGAVTSQTVKLIDGATGQALAATPTYSSATKTISLTPNANLSPGGHYEVVVSGLVDAADVVQDEAIRTFFTVAANGSRFTPIDPVRIYDSRDDNYPINSGDRLVLDLSGLAAAGATAVVLNVTATQVTRPGNVRVYPTTNDVVPPRVSNLNVMPGIDQPNLVTVALGEDGTITLMPDATSVYLIVDVSGYYATGGAAAFEPLAPVRVMDLRDGTGGVPTGRLAQGQHVDLQVTGRNGVPADAVAVVLNVTGTQTDARTHVRVYPTPSTGEPQGGPDVSNLNLHAGRDQPNLVTVKVGDGGRVRFDAPVAATYLLADLAGYYTATGDNGFVPLTPARIADTRYAQGFTGILRAGQPQTLQVTGVAGVPSDATAAVLNVTGSQPRNVTHIRVFPTTVPATLPDVSSLNLVPGRDEANLSITRIGAGGKISFYTHTADTHLIVDVSGYFRKY